MKDNSTLRRYRYQKKLIYNLCMEATDREENVLLTGLRVREMLLRYAGYLKRKLLYETGLYQ